MVILPDLLAGCRAHQPALALQRVVCCNKLLGGTLARIQALKSTMFRQSQGEYQEPLDLIGLSFAKNVSTDNVLCGNKFIMVMQSAQLRDLDNPSNTRDLPSPRTLPV